MVEALNGLAQIELRYGKPQAARQHMDRTLVLLSEAGDQPGKIEFLEVVAHWAHLVGVHETAARLMAAATRLRDEIAFPVSPGYFPNRDELLGHITKALGEKLFLEASQEGRRLDLEAALDLCRSSLREA